MSDPLLPDQTRDDTDEGWRDAADPDPEDLRRFLEERPPHHDRDH